MGDETSDAMNLDLNLGPGPDPIAGSMDSEALDLDAWIRQRFNRNGEPMRRWCHRRRIHHHHEAPFPNIPAEIWLGHIHIPENISMELNRSMVESGNGSPLQAGEGSVAGEERAVEVPKACDMNNCGVALDEKPEKGGGNDEGFFNCSICIDLARDPVVTCCGHLFCWSCLYKWLYLHSDASECPVCKGEVTDKTVTPIYGRGNNDRVPDEDSALKIPPRPNANRRVSEDSTLRQTVQRNSLAHTMEEMIRRLGTRLDLGQDLVQPNEHNNASETAERASSLSRFLAARGVRREHNLEAAPPNVAVAGLTQNSVDGPWLEGNRRYQSILRRRGTLASTQRLVEAYYRRNLLGTTTNQEQPPPVEDRGSFSSIAAVISSESQVDTAVEIDSRVSFSASSSRMRNHASRVSDVDSGDSRAQRRRRLN